MKGLEAAGHIIQLIAFAGLAVASLRLWRRRRGPAAMWLALTFATLAVVTIVAGLLPQHGHGLALAVARRVLVLVLLLFPYFLYRFTATFGMATGRLHRIITAITAVSLVATLALPRLPE